MSWSRTNLLIARAAERLGVRAEPLSSEPTDYFMVLRDGPRATIVSKTRSPFLGQLAQTLSNNKHVSRQQLRRVGLPCVPDRLIDGPLDPEHPDAAIDAALEAMLREHTAVVAKPNWGNRARDVFVGLRTLPELRRACAWACEDDADEEVVVEPHVDGTNLRIAVVGGRTVAAAFVERPRLIGDGRRTPTELLAALNDDPRRGRWDQPDLSPLDHVELDETLRVRLDRLGVPADVPLPAGRTIELLGEEQETIDCTDAIDPGWATLAERACALLGVDVGGVDLRGPATAFERPPPAAWAPGGPGLLEVNVLPALHLHALPTQGPPRPVFEAFVAYCVQRPDAPRPCADVELLSRLSVGPDAKG